MLRYCSQSVACLQNVISFHCYFHYYHINLYICILYDSMSSLEELC